MNPIKILFFTVILMLAHPLYADVINSYIERIGSGAVKDINCQNYTITAGALLDVSGGGTLREVTTFTNNGTWDYGTGRIIELGAWVNNGTVVVKPTQGTGQNLEFTTLCGPISVLGTSDTDGDGISDADEGDNAVALGHGITLDQDGDGTYNFLDEDSDNDGLSDTVEGGNDIDTDGDGIPDYLDKAATTPPTTTDDTKANQTAGDTVTVDILVNDSSGNTLDPTTVSLNSASVLGAIGSDTDNDGDIDKVIVPNEGVWTVNPVTGVVTFTPEIGFTGDPTAIEYTVKDDIGLESSPTNISIDYINALNAIDDIISANSGDAVIIPVLDNDSGDNPLDPTTVLIIDPSNGIGDTMLLVAGEGVWNVDAVIGEITFTPEVGFFADPTPIKYTVGDTEGVVSNQATVAIDYPEGTPTPTVTPTPSVTPTATPTPSATPALSDVIIATDNLNVSIRHYGGTVIDVLGNGDSFGEYGACGLSFTQGELGSTTVDDGGTPFDPKDDVIIYIPYDNTIDGIDSFEYTITDCVGNFDSAIVTLNIDCSCENCDTDSADSYGLLSMLIVFLLTLSFTFVSREKL